MKWFVVFIIVIIALIAGGIIFSQTYKPNTPSEIKTELPSPKPEETFPSIRQATLPAMLAPVKEIILTASSFSFNPQTIRVKKGERIKLVITNKDIRHTFTIKELEVDQNLPVGKTTSFELTPEKNGTFIFYCAVPGHKASGMEGKLVVE